MAPTGPFPRRANLPDPGTPCPDKNLAADTRTVDNLSAADYWARVCPGLHVGGKLQGVKPLKAPDGFVADVKSQINSEGVCQVGPGDLQWPVDVHGLAEAMVRLMQHGWPATFLLMYDEVWALIHRASKLMKGATGNACNMDVLCWYIDPNRGDAGFSPHRDRQPEDSPATFRASDGTPMYSTCWVPLTDACPENSCLYVVPRWADPGYYQGDDDDGPDPLEVALPGKDAFQAIRALPAEAGSAILFTHRIIHWGSRGRRGYHTPRLAVSWGCADDAYEPSYFDRAHLPFPPMELRAALACGQMIAYHERFNMTSKQLRLYRNFFVAHEAHFHASYRTKVATEFVGATRELLGVGAAAAGAEWMAVRGGAAGAGGGGGGGGMKGGSTGKADKGDGWKRKGAREVETGKPNKKAKLQEQEEKQEQGRKKGGKGKGHDGDGGKEGRGQEAGKQGAGRKQEAAAVAGKGEEAARGKKQGKKAAAAATAAAFANAGGGGGGSESEDDELLEDALDAMLDQQLAGRADLVDDFDEDNDLSGGEPFSSDGEGEADGKGGEDSSDEDEDGGGLLGGFMDSSGEEEEGGWPGAVSSEEEDDEEEDMGPEWEAVLGGGRKAAALGGKAAARAEDGRGGSQGKGEDKGKGNGKGKGNAEELKGAAAAGKAGQGSKRDGAGAAAGAKGAEGKKQLKAKKQLVVEKEGKKQAKQKGAEVGGAKGSKGKGRKKAAAPAGDSEDDELLEDALDAMLDQQLAGRADLVDDFDDFDD